MKRIVMNLIPASALILQFACGSGETDPAPDADGNGLVDVGPDTQISDDVDDTTDDADSGGSGGSLCDAQQRLRILDEIVTDLVADASWSFAHSSQAGRAFGLSLPGTDGGFVGEATAFMPCSEPVDFDPYCEPDSDTGLSKCLRIGCESATAGYAEVFMSDGSTQDPSAEISVSYSTRDGGAIEFSPRPLRRWVIALGAEKTVSSDFTADFTIQGDDPRRFAYQASVSTTGEGPTISSITLSFEELAGLGPAELELTHTDEDFSGSLTVGDAAVAVVESGIDWPSCSE